MSDVLILFCTALNVVLVLINIMFCFVIVRSNDQLMDLLHTLSNKPPKKRDRSDPDWWKQGDLEEGV
ncbi:hypothetical protein IID24_03095 [Patescibacteria group bacterium]|nr:hypothetical protein [Patescibacteria group bacterium]